MDLKHHGNFLTICRNFGWKCTSQRLAVYDFLYGNRTHPSVDSVLTAVRERLPTITRESVYRILNEFSDHGIIGRMDHIDSARYDSNTVPHGHFICEKCGKITDFEWPRGMSISMRTIPGKVNHTEIRLAGLCEDCLGQTAAQK